MRNRSLFFLLLLIVGYALTRLVQLTALPVFADESIYIRWAQLILDDAQQYTFFALNDGKTPLFIWLLLPFLHLFSDPLLAGRLLSVVSGAAQVVLIAQIVQELGGGRRAQFLSAVFTILFPFWVFSHRLALMDSVLTVWLSATVLVIIQLAKQPVQVRVKKLQDAHSFLRIAVAEIFQSRWKVLIGGVVLGAAFWTKLPAVLFIPTFAAFLFLPEKRSWAERLLSGVRIAALSVIGVGLFGTLKIHPAFGQLFSRGSDFLFSLSELRAGSWWDSLLNVPSYIEYFAVYLTPAAFILILGGIFFPKHRRSVLLLLAAFAIFVLPIALMGKVVYARYFLPGAVFLTAAAALGADAAIARLQSRTQFHWKKASLSVALALIFANAVSWSTQFLYYGVYDVNQLPLVRSDRVQYLEEWSSGHGILEVVNLIETQAQDRRVAVATEGFFGTLPDALLMYFHQRDVSNIYIEGIGQPVGSIPETFAERARTFDDIWLVVNSHRMRLQLPQEQLLTEYCRPNTAPCLQVWDISSVVIPD